MTHSTITRKAFIKLLPLFMLAICACQNTEPNQPEWPEQTQTSKPWTRWWWMGSAVSEAGLTANMEKYREAGIGGVEITPIYGVKGYEDQFINFLSPQWMERIAYTLEEAKRLDLGIDMATGTGWPFGGPWIDKTHACKYMAHKVYSIAEGEQLNQPVEYVQKPIAHAVGKKIALSSVKQPIHTNHNLQSKALAQIRFAEPLPLETLMAYSDDGETVDLTHKVDENGNLNWVAPPGQWTLYAIFQGWHGKMVERAAPGGEGNVIDHFSKAALDSYLSHFDQKFARRDIDYLRCFFNDSYEVDDAHGQANWTPQLFRAFEKNRGYDLRQHLPALLGQDTDEQNVRVLSDYRLTVDELLLEQFTHQWQNWAAAKNKRIRNQAHGSPANILDLYGASDIPETEGNDIMRFKFATSAAHVTGKPLVSSETATWLNEHFNASWSDVKIAVDKFFLSGVNHIFYHGTNYSPPEEKWPGWLFYAAVHFSPANPQWKDFSVLNQYITRTQSFLQSGNPDNDVLLYFPVSDRYAEQGNAMLHHFDGMEGFKGTSFKHSAEWLHENGYAFDFISDRQIKTLQTIDGKLMADSSSYETIVIPETQFMPLKTFEHLIRLAENGCTVMFLDHLPKDVPGLGNLKHRQSRLQSLKEQLQFEESENAGSRSAYPENGKVSIETDLGSMLASANIRQESLVQHGLEFVRRTDADGPYYFITNWSGKHFNGWVTLQSPGLSAAVFNPMTSQKGKSPVKKQDDESIQVYIQLENKSSCIIKTYQSDLSGNMYPYYSRTADAIVLDGPWSVNFTSGGPQIPEDTILPHPMEWTEIENAKSFSGTARYTTNFARPERTAASWELNLGEVYETVRVVLNGQETGTLIGPDYKITFDDELLKQNNQLEIYVSNLMANRIAYMDRHKVKWKKFYNVNFPAKRAENRNENGIFDASHWKPYASGLKGPVTLTPLEAKTFGNN